ncbi:MAG: nitrate transport permease nrtB [Rhodospirillales bacterium RIFCSPLOWO2_12_FULL_58_28]|nr:MAG: nitrate transport permease nrtB [Rhodospirillales bacterium RIFCSPLOWO2_02_FULL_58_16]OHC77057.1 MAG: nitrate transport permease nrtB [Rhodospirillales bacterium RIFCSPLOWO2_12_FULL_58_28]
MDVSGLLINSSNRATAFVRGAALFVFLLIVWSSLTYSGFIKPLFLPAPHAVVKEMIILFVEKDFLTDVLASLSRVLFGFVLSAALAVPLGIMMGASRRWKSIFMPIIGFIRYMPAAAFIPLLILWLGIGFAEKVAVIFISIFFYLVLLVADAASHVRNECIDAALTLGASPRQVLNRVIVPSSLPGIWDALRIMMGVGWTMIVVAELVAAERGIGAVIIQAQRFLQTPRIIAGIIVIGILGVLTDAVFKYLRVALFPWDEQSSGVK